MTGPSHSTGFATLALHAGADPRAATDTYADLAAGLLGRTHRPLAAGSDPGTLEGAYDTVSDPMVAALEERVAALEGGTAAVATASGRAAYAIAFHVLLRPGDTVVVSRGLRHPAYSLPHQALTRSGSTVRWVDPTDADAVAAALSEPAKLIVIESVAMSGDVIDLTGVAAAAAVARVPLLVDNSLATSYLARPLEHGAHAVILSTAGPLSGRGSPQGGLVVDGGTFDWMADRRFPALSEQCGEYGDAVFGDVFGNFALAAVCRLIGLRDLGPVLSPVNAMLALAGIETLALRVQRQCETALAVAQHLARHPAVHWVDYAGLPSHPSCALARRILPRGAGTTFGFGPAGGPAAALEAARRFKLISPFIDGIDARSRSTLLADRAGRWGDRPDDDSQRPEAMLLSIGLEDPGDLIADLDQALAP